jgi:hypothetical protein
MTMMGERFFLFSMFVILLWGLKAKSDHLRRRSLIPKDIAVGGRF